MPTALVDGLEIAYEVIGEGRPWIVTPGGRYDKESPGVRELAEALAAGGAAAVVWDRPNTGASSVCFAGDSESAMQADALAGLLRHLDLGPAVIAGGSGGARVSLLAASRHPDVTAGVAAWWISGGPYGLLTLGTHYCGESIKAGWNGGMEAVAALPEWAGVQAANPANRDRLLALDHQEFVATMQRWMVAYCPCGDQLVPGLDDAEARALDKPALVFRSGISDMNHTRATSEALAGLLPLATLVEPPWGDTEWVDRQAARNRGESGLFSGWPQLAEPLLSWAATALG
jgi:pimeloyl-ACP methyl ester carboxylesterase